MSWSNWLKTSLTKLKYQQKERVLNDVVNAITHFPDLVPSCNKFSCKGRTDRDLVCLSGTIPVKFKTRIYNIPVCIWVPESYPHFPPLVYVKPTANMVLKPNQYIDDTGKVYLPYLTDWTQQKSDLYSLIQILCLQFSDLPPVFSKAIISHASQSPEQQLTASQIGTSETISQTDAPKPREPNELKNALLSLIEDKLRKKLADIFEQTKIDLDSLQSSDEELQQRSQQLKKILEKLKQSEISCPLFASFSCPLNIHAGLTDIAHNKRARRQGIALPCLIRPANAAQNQPVSQLTLALRGYILKQ